MQDLVNNNLQILDFQNLSTWELIFMANKERESWIGLRFELCSIMNAKSGFCNEDCKFCAQSSRYKTQALIYPLKSSEEILKEAEIAENIGAERFGIVTSGRSLSKKEIETLAEAIQQIKKQVKMRVCASLGILDKDSLIILKEAGLSRYHHNIETSPEFFPYVTSTHRFGERTETIKTAKEVGLEVCSGGIIGMGEKEDDRIRMALILKELDVDSIPINILVPIAGTPFEERTTLSVLDILRTIAIFRLILKNRTIKIAAGRESALKNFQGLAFLAGANGMLIGGYLTIKGRGVEEDHRMVEEIKRLWNG